jgi:hypothetical protein
MHPKMRRDLPRVRSGEVRSLRQRLYSGIKEIAFMAGMPLIVRAPSRRHGHAGKSGKISPDMCSFAHWIAANAV